MSFLESGETRILEKTDAEKTNKQVQSLIVTLRTLYF